MKRVLVTGATGGLGLSLTAAFQDAGWQVRATGRSGRGAERLRSLGAQFLQADLVTSDSTDVLCHGMDLVVHAAALSASWGTAAEFEAINVDATRRVMDSAQRAGCGGFVFVSSPSIYAAMRDRIDLTEDDSPTTPPLNHYARSKLAAERLVLTADRPGFFTCAVRPRALVGPDDRVLLPRLVALAQRGWIPLLRGGNALVELTDVRDAAAAIVSAGTRLGDIRAQAINISGGKAIAIGELTRKLAAALNISAHCLPVPMWIARIVAAKSGARSGSREPVLTPYTLATLAFSQTFDLTKARRVLEYEPRHDAMKTILQCARALA